LRNRFFVGINISIRHCALRPHTPDIWLLASSGLSESCSKIGDVPKSPVPHIGSPGAVGRHNDASNKRVTDYNHKLIEIVRTNTCAAFDNVHELLGAKSPSEFFELSTAQMRKQFEIVSGQNNQLCALTQEIATEAAGAIKTGSSKAFNKAS
jgi:hypothetical protein